MQASRLRQILIAVKKQRYLTVPVTKTTNVSGDTVLKITELTQLDLPQSEVYNSRYKIMKSVVSAEFDRFCWLSVSLIAPRMYVG
jgi:hypothetical protein